MANSPQFNSLQSSYTNTINNDDKSIIMSSMDEFKKMKVQVRRPLYFVVCCLVLLSLSLCFIHFPILNSSLNSPSFPRFESAKRSFLWCFVFRVVVVV